MPASSLDKSGAISTIQAGGTCSTLYLVCCKVSHVKDVDMLRTQY